MLNEKELLFPILSNHQDISHSCNSADGIMITVIFDGIDIVSFFNQNKDILLKNCTDFRDFAHCHEYYLFQYDSNNKHCHTYYHENCISSSRKK